MSEDPTTRCHNCGSPNKYWQKLPFSEMPTDDFKKWDGVHLRFTNIEKRVERLEKALTLRSEYIDELDTRVEKLEHRFLVPSCATKPPDPVDDVVTKEQTGQRHDHTDDQIKKLIELIRRT